VRAVGGGGGGGVRGVWRRRCAWGVVVAVAV